MRITADNPAVTIITPTGDRPGAFALCERWMRAQTWTGDAQWIVADDGTTPTTCTMGQQHVRREPSSADPPHTLCANLRAALPLARSGRVIIVEDDDYYGPQYVATMMAWLDKADLAGEVGAKYYDLRYGWYRFRSRDHASLCRTGAKGEAVGAMLAAATGTDHPSVDLRLWSSWRGSKHTMHDEHGTARLCVGIKGMPGRASPLHVQRKGYQQDTDFQQLRLWVGDDWPVYGDMIRAERRSRGRARIAVYTALFGGYDAVAIPRVIAKDEAEYIMFTDQQDGVRGPWDVRLRKPQHDAGPRENRWYKTLAHEHLPAFDWWIYADANMIVKQSPRKIIRAMQRKFGDHEMYLPRHPYAHTTQDEARWVIGKSLAPEDQVTRQIERYVAAGMPGGLAVPQCGFCVRAQTPAVREFNRIWWEEVRDWSYRDQVSFCYAAWRSKVDVSLYDRTERFRWVYRRRHLKQRPTFA